MDQFPGKAPHFITSDHHFHRDMPVALRIRDYSENSDLLHSHEFHELVLVLGGSGLHVLQERSYPIYPGAVSYTHLQQSDGTILCVYDRDRYGAGEILLAEFTEADLRAGSLPHPPRVIHSLSGRPETAAHQTMNKQEMELVP